MVGIIGAAIRPSKEVAIALAARLAPQYAAALGELKGSSGGGLQFSERLRALLHWIGPLVSLYEDEQKLNSVLAFGLMGEQGFKDWGREMEALKRGDERRYLDDLINDEGLDTALDVFKLPETTEELAAAKEVWSRLPDDEKAAAAKQASAFYAGLFGGFFNAVSLMVHGAKLTDLVPMAMRGDEAAFLKALQIDRRLLIHHLYFRDVKQRAQDEGNKELLSKIAYRETNPALRGKIRYPGLYMVFAILQSMRWLDDLTHAELLGVCDAAGLDRYQNRIDDVCYLTKRLGEYRRLQKSGGVSMH